MSFRFSLFTALLLVFGGAKIHAQKKYDNQQLLALKSIEKILL
jgi:hypothetical protein